MTTLGIKNHNINDVLGNLIVETVRAQVLGEKKRTKLVDTLRTSGWTASDFISPKSKGSTATEESFAWVKGQIVLGFTAEVQKLLAKPVSNCTEKQKADRRYWSQQVGARLSDLKRGLTPKADKGPQTQRTIYQFVDDEMAEVVKRVKAAEKIAGLDIPAFLKAVGVVQKMIREANKVA
jgi:hypothetical protein